MLKKNVKARAMPIIAAGLALWCAEAAALSEADVLGTWCSDAGRTELTHTRLNIFRADGQRFSFRVVRYEYGDGSVTVHWINSRDSESTTTYSRFGRDGKTMVQEETRQAAERPHWRC